MSAIRRPDESFDQFQARRKAENSTENTYLRGHVVHISKGIIKLSTQEMVDAANNSAGAGKFKLGDEAIIHRIYRKPPDAKLSKEQRRRLRKIAASATKVEATNVNS
jgi:hypothetical protein